jgi:ATP-dependent HslUV protease subunit HslV
MLLKHTTMEATEIVKEALEVAADLCIYTNKNIHIEEL